MEMLKPQSNQRGIETAVIAAAAADAGGSLNRTSVGLKPGCSTRKPGGTRRLNRTSVGLKRSKRRNAMTETRQASIEPAWD